MVGCYLLLMSVFRIGAVSSLLSEPLVSGFRYDANIFKYSALK